MKKIPLALILATALATHAFGQSSDTDNTANNARDRDGDTLTPIDQSNEPADIKITAEARKMVVADDDLSMTAKNVKIITVAGVVTLRGPVESEAEKTAIAKYAKKAGATSVTNQLEINKP